MPIRTLDVSRNSSVIEFARHAVVCTVAVRHVPPTTEGAQPAPRADRETSAASAPLNDFMLAQSTDARARVNGDA